MKIKVSKATNLQIDWLVAKCEGVYLAEPYPLDSGCVPFRPSTNWAQGGPIIERECITVGPYHGETGAPTGVFQGYIGWDDTSIDPLHQCDGPTPLIAAMRCFVASKMGDEVEVPDELT